MRGASSKVAQERPGDSTQGEAAGGDLELLDGNSGGRDPVPNIELPSDHADEPSGHQDFANFEARAQDSVSGFNENQADEDDEQVVATGQASEQPAAQPFLGFDTGQLPMLIGGGVLLLIGGLAMLSKLSSKSKKKSNTYRAPVEQVDPERKVRGQFKPSERFKKPKPEPEFESETSLGDLPDQVGVSNLVVAQDAPLRVRSTSAGEEFDFSADMDEAEFELFESDELVEAEPEMPEVTNNDGSLSARPPESHQDSNLSFVESPGLLNSHFVRSSTAPVGAAELAYFGSSKRDIHQEKSSSENDEGVLGELGQEFGSELPEEGQSEGLVDQKIGSSQSAADFSDELIDQQPVRANSEDEEAVMNLQDDDSELEFDFDLSEETGIGDSDADFNFELDDDDASVALSQDASDIAIQSDSPAVVDSADEPIVAEPVAELDAVVETQADPTPAEVAVSSADDSAEFADMFEDSSEDLVGLELNAPADVVEQVEVIAATASDMADDVDFSDIELDGSAAVAVAEPLGDVVDAGIGGVVESVGDVVGDAVGGIAETAQGATEAVADAAGGFSNAAKATAVVAGTAGAAAGGGILARLFGWGKNKDIAEPAEDVISETSEQISEIAQNVVSPAEQIVDETFPEGTDNANAIVDAADVVGPDAEAELSLVDGGEIEIFDEAADDEFNFDLQDDDEFSFADPELDADSAEAEKGFSSMDTLREPERLAAGFSSADTIREPENVVEADSDGLGIAALGGTLAAGAAAAFALNTSPADLEEPAESIEAESEPVRGLGIFDGNSDEDAAADSKTSELEAKIEELQQANQKLEESTKTLEEKLEASLAQSEKAGGGFVRAIRACGEVGRKLQRTGGIGSQTGG